MNTRYKVALLLCAMMLIATAPSAFGTITYGGANVEVPTSNPAVAAGDTGTLNNWAGALIYNTPKMTAGVGWPRLMTIANNNIVVDPSGPAPYTKYCRSWVFTGASLPAGFTGDAAAEWTGTLAPASASEVLNTGDTIIMSASANGQSHSEIHATTAGTIPTTAQTLIDAWAGSRTLVSPNPSDRDLYGNAQITSTAQTNAAGSVSTGATAAGYTGNDEPQPYAVAGFSAQRITMSSGSTRVPGAISGTVTGTTSVEIANALGGPVAARAPGWAAGYATANTYAMAAASDLPNTRSYSLSDIRSSAGATRTTNGQTAVLARSDGTASSEAWDSSRNWASPTAPGTGNSITSVTGKTVAQATAMRAGDRVFGDPLVLGPVLAARSPDGLQTWSQMLAVASKGQSVNQILTNPYERDAFTFAYTSARVIRTTGSTADANRAIGATWLGSASTTDANLPLTSGASLNAKSAETQSGFNTAATLSNIGMSSGAHTKRTTTTFTGPIFQGSTAKLAAKAHFTGVGTQPQQVAIGNVLAYPAGSFSPTGFLNGFTTNGPGFTGEGWDDAGSYIIAGSQDATTTGSSGTYSLTAQPTDVREWVTGASLLNNNWILQRPAPLDWQKPQTVNAVPNLQEIPVAGRNPDSYQWSGDLTGPS